MRLIDADATIVAIERAGLELGTRGRIEEAANYFIAARILRESALLKPIEAEPVRHGHWRKILVPKKWNGPVVRCSECNFGGYTGSKYCPDCGAKMDLEV